MPDAVIHVPIDEIDLGTATDLRTLLATVEPTEHVTIDLHDVAFCDTTGINELIHARNRHRTAGGSLHVINPRSQVRNLIHWAGLDDILDDTRARHALSSSHRGGTISDSSPYGEIGELSSKAGSSVRFDAGRVG